MNHIILIAHGRLALEMKNSAQMLFGELPNFHAIEFLADEGLDSLQEKISKKMEALKSPVLIFADLFCGTPFNASCAVSMKNPTSEIEIISGMSLPLVLEAAVLNNSGKSLNEISKCLISMASDTVRIFELNQNQDEEDLL